MRCSSSVWRPEEAKPAATRVIKKQKFGVCASLTLRRSPAWVESDLYALQNLRLTPSAFSTLSIHLSLCVLSPQSNITTTICHSDYQVRARSDTPRTHRAGTQMRTLIFDDANQIASIDDLWLKCCRCLPCFFFFFVSFFFSLLKTIFFKARRRNEAALPQFGFQKLAGKTKLRNT